MPGKVIRVDLGARLRWEVEVHEDYLLGTCDVLGLTAMGDSHRDLFENIVEILDDLFHDLITTGELAQFLNDRGWARQPAPIPQMDPHDRPWLDVPVEIIHHNAPCYA